jgi:hypothetical protein
VQSPVIAVDAGLTPYGDALERAGYRVVPLTTPPHAAGVAAVVVDGLDERMLGMTGALGAAPVISVEGRSPDEVVAAVRRRVEA